VLAVESSSAAVTASDALAGRVKAWVALTAYKAGMLVTQGGVTYTRNADGTSRAAFDATELALWTVLPAGAASAGALPFTPTGNIAATNAQAAIAEVATDAAASIGGALLGQAVGERAGVPVQPGSTPPPIGPELAVVANLKTGYSVTLPIPTLTANGTNQNSRTLIGLGNLANGDLAYRVRMNVAALPTNGWAGVLMRVVDSAGTILAGSVQQYLVTNISQMTGWYEFDFKANPAWAVGTTYLEVRLDIFNNATTGSLQVSSLSVKEIAAPQRPMLYGQFGGTSGSLPASGYAELWQPLYDPVAGLWRCVSVDLNQDSALSASLGPVNGYSNDRPFRWDRLDPDFLAATASISADTINSATILLAGSEVARSMRIGNNDQVLEVLKADGTTWELRGNTHGGETLRGTTSPNLVYEVDNGDGTWTAWGATTDGTLRSCRRFRFTFKTKLTRSAPDSDDFANVDHVATFFPDGMCRLDRTTTFLSARRIRNLFEWMSSHDLTVPQVGRIGAGTLVLDEVDVFAKVATPAAPTAAANNAAGALPAATYRYVITRLTEGGETDPSPSVTQAVTGGTSTVTLTFPAPVTGQTGWRVYGRANDATRMVLLATLQLTATTWADDYTVPAYGPAPPLVNRARRMDSPTSALDSAISDKATWGVWYDPTINLCLGNIYDRDSVLDRTGVAGTKMRLERGNGIRKNYLTVHWTGDGSPSPPDGETRLVPSGEVWTATHWAFAYVPADRNEYHREIAARATKLTALKALYPAT
jgi:hypothetical protein